VLPGDEQVGCAPAAQFRDRPCACSVDPTLGAILERIARAHERSALALERLAGAQLVPPGEWGAAGPRAEVTGPRREPVNQPRPVEVLPVMPVSLARAAKLLGVSKSRTLRPEVEAGVVRTVGQGKRRRVPPDELRRLAAEGVNSPRRAASKRPNAARTGPPLDLAAELARVASFRPE
jgi:hypothetical protein